MKKILSALILVFALGITTVFAGEWEDLINEALKQAPSKYKRKTRSGRRLLREKRERLLQIDRELPVLLQKGNYARAEEVLKEALRLTIESVGVNNVYVVERFVSLGIVYMEAGKQFKAIEAFNWALRIGEPILGEGSYQLSNVYKFLAIAYYEAGSYAEAFDNAVLLLSIYRAEFGPDDPRTEEAKELLEKIQGKSR
jgi:tetratricopeptide (TPR) repeat protein